MSKEIISPIAIDLGAENTGVYFAHYEAGSKLDNIEKQGVVYKLDKQSYTLLMAGRTANRHQRRGFDRRQLAKRLFKLIWEQRLNLNWDGDVQQTIGFLMNRRGFTFLTEEYDPSALETFPAQAFAKLPRELKHEINEVLDTGAESSDTYDLRKVLETWSQDGQRLGKNLESMKSAPKRLNAQLVSLGRLKKLKELCEHKLNAASTENPKGAQKGSAQKGGKNKKGKSDLDRISPWILKDWKDKKVRGLDAVTVDRKSANVEEYVQGLGEAQIKTILSSIYDGVDKDRAKIKSDVWQFSPETFNLEKAVFQQGDSDDPSASDAMVKTHLNHLTYAADKLNSELKSGARYRSKYFDEISEVLVKNAGNKKNKKVEDEDKYEHGYIKRFREQLGAGQFGVLTATKLTHLLGHISNLELKPLRKYFNDPAHGKGDYWDEKRLQKYFDNWVLREWRVDPASSSKKEGGRQDYKELKRQWRPYQTNDKGVVDFFMATDPCYTIPPYQSNNNRRPPKCQSYILNPVFLSKHYPKWENWLETLSGLGDVKKYLGDYVAQLKSVKSSKQKGYFDQVVSGQLLTDSGKRGVIDLNARILQFIFDRIKISDTLNLNEIYSHAKKMRQTASNKKEKAASADMLKETLAQSKLPAALKGNISTEGDDPFASGSFLHLACKYYKMRQRARDGRIFIHPEYKDNHKIGRGFEDSGRFSDEHTLLKYCNFKPRQKRYQLLNDLSGVLQVSPGLIEELAGGSEEARLLDWLKSFKFGRSGLQGLCKKAEDLQKERGGRLKMDISSAYFKKDFHEKMDRAEKNPKDIDQKEWNMLEKYRGTKKPGREDKALIRLCNSIRDAYREIAVALKTGGNQFDLSLANNPAAAVYLFAQISNIAFKDRQGNASTCSVCSADNAQRMHGGIDEGAQTETRAQRLPAVPSRMIDGGAKRMARILGKSIAETKWGSIDQCLKQKQKVCVPIITELNRFEFEPSKETLVKEWRPAGTAVKKKIPKIEDEVAVFESKNERIKRDSMGVCPYCGQGLGNDGEIDHIVPRKSQWGTLNDEANLIYAHGECNRKKGNTRYSLSRLHKNYLMKVFGESSASAITKIIAETIESQGDGNFRFGSYLNFSNLNLNQQKCFRHALFLEEANDLRNSVISSINNRIRAFVNGTQRYFAEVLANELHKKAKKAGHEELLSFDFFGVRSDDSPEGVFNLRKRLECIDELRSELLDYSKYEVSKGVRTRKKGPQKPYSHVIDAHLAFLISLKNHQRDGTFKINQDIDLERNHYSDIGSDKVSNLFEATKVAPHKLDVKPLKRNEARKEYDGREFFQHRILFDSNAGAWHFVKLIQLTVNKETCYIKGFLELGCLKECLEQEDWKKSIDKNYGYTGLGKYGEILVKKIDPIVDLYQFSDERHQFGCAGNNSPANLLMDNQTIGGKTVSARLLSIDKSRVAEFLIENFNTKTAPDAWDAHDSKIHVLLSKLWYFTIREKITEEVEKLLDSPLNFADAKVLSPLFNPSLIGAWQNLQNEWNDYKERPSDNEGGFGQFLREHFRPASKQPHQKARKVYSLPKKFEQGFMLIKRMSWTGEVVYQCLSGKNGSDGTKLYAKRLVDGKPYDSLSNHFRTGNIVLLKPLTQLKKHLNSKGKPISTDEWYDVAIPDCLKTKVVGIKNRSLNAGDSLYRVKFKNPINTKDIVDLMLDGFAIDEMRTGGKQDKKEVRSVALQLFMKDGDFLSLDESRVMLKSLLDDLTEKKFARPDLIPDGHEPKKFLGKWLEIMSLQTFDDECTLRYKRGVPLVIDNVDG